MARTTISFTDPNQAWLEMQIASKEFKSHSDVINSVLRQTRKRENEIARLQALLSEGRESGISDTDPRDLLAKFKTRIKQDEKI